MKIYVQADMEGIWGINRKEHVSKDSPTQYAEGKRLLIQEINFVVDKLFKLGATEVVVNDTHGSGGNIDINQMDPRASYSSSWSGMMAFLDESFDGLILLGHHAKAGTLNGFLDHTQSSASVFSFFINGVEMGEIGIEAAYAGHFNVPVIAVTGDAKTAEEATDLLKDVACAVVKHGMGRNSACCLPYKEAYDNIEKALEEGVKLIGKVQPFKPSLPAVIEITYYRSDYSHPHWKQPYFEQVNARTLRQVVQTFHETSFFW